MANTQLWRLHTTRSRYPSDTLLDPAVDEFPPDDTVISTSIANELSKPRPRARKGISSITTYLNTHHHAATPSVDAKISMPFLDWSNLKGDDAYGPDLGLMSNAIRQQLLLKPSEQLPESFNGPLLHIIEAHEKLLVERDDLQENQGAQVAEPRQNVNKSQGQPSTHCVSQNPSCYGMPAHHQNRGQREEVRATLTTLPVSAQDKHFRFSSAMTDRERNPNHNAQPAECMEPEYSTLLRNLPSRVKTSSTNTASLVFQRSPDALTQAQQPYGPRPHAGLQGRGHCRCFSFQPGDDVETLATPNQESRDMDRKLKATTMRVRNAAGLQTLDLEDEIEDDLPESPGLKNLHPLFTPPTAALRTPLTSRRDTSKNNESHTTSEQRVSRSSTSFYDSVGHKIARHTEGHTHRPFDDFAIAAARAARGSASSSRTVP